MKPQNEGKIALDSYENFKTITIFLRDIAFMNWLGEGIPPILNEELAKLKQIVEDMGGAIPLMLQEMLIPEDLGQMDAGVELVKQLNKKH